jgi:hypothetical protein
MEMLILKPAGLRKTGETRRVAVVRTRGRKYGPIESEKVLSVFKDVLISGPASCGKTRWLDKFYLHAHEVWRKQEAIYIRAVDPLEKWYDDVRLRVFATSHDKDWDKLKRHERLEMLINWVKHCKPVLILDDTHKLAGKKLDAVLQLARAAGRVVSATFAEQRTPITLRMALDLRNPQKVQLASEAPYDYTSILMWLVVIISLFAGMWQLCAVLLSMKVLSHGKRASKQI